MTQKLREKIPGIAAVRLRSFALPLPLVLRINESGRVSQLFAMIVFCTAAPLENQLSKITIRFHVCRCNSSKRRRVEYPPRTNATSGVIVSLARRWDAAMYSW